MELQIERAKGRKALLRLLRPAMAVVCIAIILGQQPFMLRRRHRQHVAPLQLAISGAFRAPAVVSSPNLLATVNRTSRMLLTPLEYLKVPRSKRSVTLAYSKTDKILSRIVRGNSSMAHTAEIATRPMPNVPLLGAWLVTFSPVAALVCPGVEVLTLAGCGCLSLGCSGLKPQPELFAVVVLALLGLLARSFARAPVQIKEPRIASRRRRDRPCEEQAAPKSCCGGPPEGPMPRRMREAFEKKSQID